ncbi:metal ion binding protein, putative [Ricinus communis]|uniref:Metal ion binding protein, putative n=1 Tax=Ricinus communis TaxID=3988 RepID=B9S7X6_RICCO|nr:metal ion binding protein, putative [Ricinus communis]
MQKIVFGVDTNCHKCKTEVLKTVTRLEEIDSEKGTLTVIGEVDPFQVVKRLKRAGKIAEIISVGPPKRESKEADKQEPSLPHCSKKCELVASLSCPERQVCCTLQSSPCYIIK